MGDRKARCLKVLALQWARWPMLRGVLFCAGCCILETTLGLPTAGRGQKWNCPHLLETVLSSTRTGAALTRRFPGPQWRRVAPTGQIRPPATGQILGYVNQLLC